MCGDGDGDGDGIGGFGIADTDPGEFGEAPSAADIGAAFGGEPSGGVPFSQAQTHAEFMGMSNAEMNIAMFGGILGGAINALADPGVLSGEVDPGDPIGEDDEGPGDDISKPPTVAPIAKDIGGLKVKSPLDAAEEERRRIARRKGRKSTLLTNNLEFPPNVMRKTLLGS